MMYRPTHKFTHPLSFSTSLTATLLLCGPTSTQLALADDDNFHPGNLLVSRVIYDNNRNNVAVGDLLPPNCLPANCVTAVADGTYPQVFNNAPIDGSFGITSKIILDQLNRGTGEQISSLEVPNSSQRGIRPESDQMVGSFSSKSEVALNLSTDARYVTFMGYLAPVDTLDVSNSNTPFVIDPTNPVPGAYYRVVAQVDQHGIFSFTKSNAYSGNNGRAAILNSAANIFYTSGNAGNGSNPQPNGVIVGAGLQIATDAYKLLGEQMDPGLPTPVGSFNITELGDAHDKIGKDTNFRGLSIFNNVIYTTKGSGGNGIDTVYFIDTSGSNATTGNPNACPNGVGVPAPGTTLPTTPIVYNSANLQTKGVYPYNMCILKGFNTTLASTKPAPASFPFGVWFANATTLYVADEGNGTNTFSGNTYTAAAAQTTAGLQKWIYNASQGQWNLAYVLTAGLNLGVPYTVDHYPTGTNTATSLPWSPATDGLRNLTGQVDNKGKATIWAITSTVSGSGDQGADPNKLVMIIDDVAATTLPAGESFTTLRTARFAEVLRGVSFTPGTEP